MPRRFFIEPENLKYPFSTLTGQDFAHAKNALRLKPDSWDAKINLELSIAAMIKADASARVQTAPHRGRSGEEKEDPEREELLQSIHKEERPSWVSAPTQEVYEQDW